MKKLFLIILFVGFLCIKCIAQNSISSLIAKKTDEDKPGYNQKTKKSDEKKQGFGMSTISSVTKNSNDDNPYGWLSEREYSENEFWDKMSSPNEIRIWRNAIFAKYGYIFEYSPDLTEHFSQFSWYKPNKDNVNANLTSIEIHNVNILKRLETNLKIEKEITRSVLRNDKKQEIFKLYKNVIRKYSWYEGVGEPISQEVANKLPLYYKLSMPNKKGHWQYIQAMYQDTMTTNHPQTPYVLDKNYDKDEVSRKWRDEVAKVTQWFIVSDLDGNVVVEERAYDKNNYMVYSFIPVKVKPNKIIGSYNDSFGLPIDMRPDSTSTYGSTVAITFDRCGRDSIIDNLDGAGYNKFNSNGVDQTRYIYDDKDRKVLQTSHNLLGDYIKDNWGNCGHKYIYNDSTGVVSIICIDEELKPMRKPSVKADGLGTYIRCDITFDEYGRTVKREFLNETGVPDVTLTGLHRIEYHYNEKGKLILEKFYDINGNGMSKDEAKTIKFQMR